MVIHVGARSVINMEDSSKRRPFFSSPDELFDEEYYDEQLPEKKRRLTAEQVLILHTLFRYLLNSDQTFNLRPINTDVIET